MWVFLLWIFCMLLAAYIAGQKQRSTWWCLVGLVFGPIGVIMVALLPTLPRAMPEGGPPGHTRICPFCAESIKAAAIVCKHCGRDLPALSPEFVFTEPTIDTLPSIGVSRNHRE